MTAVVSSAAGVLERTFGYDAFCGLVDGRVTVTLQKLVRGIHLVTVRYLGSDQLGGSTSIPSVPLVW